MEEVLKDLDKKFINLISSEQAWHYNAIPYSETTGGIELVIDKSKNIPQSKAELEALLGRQIKLSPVEPNLVTKYLQVYYRKAASYNGPTFKNLNISEGDEFLQKLITEAKHLGSSDIHIEAYEELCRIRLRMDGHLVERFHLNKSEYPNLINQIKSKADIDTTERRLPQDGRINYKFNGLKFDIRVSVLPTLHGEKIVLRLLSNDATNIDINLLGLDEKQLRDYLEGVKRPHGILLISGPTGSGKTTTLYATLKQLNKEDSNILTVEDPIEYTLPGINQVQLREDIGLTFASALRTFLRQDPDIIMLGEIRDGETAQMAIRAALTGHLVLSTIHTNSAWGTISRLQDMGVPSFLIANTLNTSIAQRLVRVLCPHCKKEETFNESLLPPGITIEIKLEKHFVAVGCDYCHYTGYKGRRAIYEVIPVTKDLAAKIKEGVPDVEKELTELNISTLSSSAAKLLISGETSLDEVYSIISGG